MMRRASCLLLLAVVAVSARPQEGATRTVRRRVAAASPVVRSTRQVAREEPIQIVRSVYNAPTGKDQAWDYSFETENGIKQEARGEMKRVDDVDVIVMRGSYSYIGADSLTYVVDWYADETGFHPSAPHLPQPVEIPFPEQAVAVEAQLRFAEEQRQARAESNFVEDDYEYDNSQTNFQYF